MKKWIVLLSFVVILLLLAACGGEETGTPETPEVTQPPTSIPEATEMPPVLLEISTVPIEEIVNINWQWVELREMEPASQTLVPNPGKYTLVLWDDGTFAIQADCNVGQGSYSADGSELTLQPGPMTLAACGPESLYDLYLLSLVDVNSFGMNEDQLVLLTNAGKSQLVFENAGPAEKPGEEPRVCAGIDMQSWALDTMELPYSRQPNCLPATTYDKTQPAGPSGIPEHAQINFGVTDPSERQVGDPIIYVIPVAEYEQLWETNGDQSVTNSIDALQTLLVDKPEQIPISGMPVLPYEEVSGTNDLDVQGKYLDIKMGSGVRFVGRFSQDPNPVVNDNPQLFYIFQGFTTDGQYLISFFYPVSTEALPTSDDVPDEERQAVESDPETYMQTKAEELNALQPSDWEPDLATLDAVIASLEFEYEPVVAEQPPASAQLTNINWQWSELVETEPAAQTVVPNPQNYVIIFLTDGTIDILADCNFGGGTYSLDGNNITITVGEMTKIACEEGSLSDQFITQLGNVSTYQLTIPKLTLKLNEDAGSMSFTNGGPAIIPPVPGEGSPTATTTEPVNVRGGPGTAYPTYGVVPASTLFEVVGISELGDWWVVKLPTDIATSGQGWINANYVETTNTENVPVVKAPPLEGEPPASDKPTAVALEPINVRSGPGTAYTSYGVVSIGATAEVIGISEDGQWWVIKLPTDIAPDGRGWVKGDYVKVTNAENVPVIETPPLP